MAKNIGDEVKEGIQEINGILDPSETYRIDRNKIYLGSVRGGEPVADIRQLGVNPINLQQSYHIVSSSQEDERVMNHAGRQKSGI